MMSDDLDNDDLDLDNSFDDFAKSEGTLGDLWRNNALFKIGVIVGIAVVIFGLLMLFGGGSDPVELSEIGTNSEISSIPGTSEAPQAYIEAVEQVNEEDVERAFSDGTSSLPVPIEPPVSIVSLPEESPDAEDPLQRWRRLQEERLKRELEQSQALIKDEDVSQEALPSKTVTEISESLSEQMASILEAKPEVKLSSMVLTEPDFLANLAAAREEELNEEITKNGLIEEKSVGELLLPAGKIAYAQLLIEANTDVPGPVLAQVMSGPLKGSRILGSFVESNELLTLNFDTIVFEEESFSIDAIALDPATTLPGLATEVDHRYFKRVILPAAAAFVGGIADAIAETDTNTVTVQGDTVISESQALDAKQEVAAGIAEAGQEVRTIIDEIANDTEVLVRIAAGTPLGILFLEPVIRDVNIENNQAAFTVPIDMPRTP